jgi:hypothetical protein
MPARTDPARRRLALLIACTEYGDEMLVQLPASGQDVDALGAVLGDPLIGGFEVEVLLNKTSGAVGEGINEFIADLVPDDELLIYLSCHGVLDGSGRLYYAAVNTRLKVLPSTAVAASWLNERLEDCRAQSQILMLDCCHSGAFDGYSKGNSELQLGERFRSRGRGRVVMTASGSTEFAYSEHAITGETVRSVFTSAVIDGLSTGDADRDEDGLITTQDLFRYVEAKVHAAEPRQVPRLWTYNARGDLVVAYSVRGVPQPDPLPADLRAALASSRPRVREAGVVELAHFLDSADEIGAVAGRDALQTVADSDDQPISDLARAVLAAPAGAASEYVLAHRARAGQPARTAPVPEVAAPEVNATAEVANAGAMAEASAGSDTGAGPAPEAAPPEVQRLPPVTVEPDSAPPLFRDQLAMRAAGRATLSVLLVMLAFTPFGTLGDLGGPAVVSIMFGLSVLGLLITARLRPARSIDTFASGWNFAWFAALSVFLVVANGQADRQYASNSMAAPGGGLTITTTARSGFIGLLVFLAAGNALAAALAFARSSKRRRNAAMTKLAELSGLIAAGCAILIVSELHPGQASWAYQKGVLQWGSTAVLFVAALVCLPSSVLSLTRDIGVLPARYWRETRVQAAGYELSGLLTLILALCLVEDFHDGGTIGLAFQFAIVVAIARLLFARLQWLGNLTAAVAAIFNALWIPVFTFSVTRDFTGGLWSVIDNHFAVLLLGVIANAGFALAVFWQKLHADTNSQLASWSEEPVSSYWLAAQLLVVAGLGFAVAANARTNTEVALQGYGPANLLFQVSACLLVTAALASFAAATVVAIRRRYTYEHLMPELTAASVVPGSGQGQPGIAPTT